MAFLKSSNFTIMIYFSRRKMAAERMIDLFMELYNFCKTWGITKPFSYKNLVLMRITLALLGKKNFDSSFS